MHFKNKIILCNCDDPKCSKFTFYFKEKFKQLGLKKLICTCYKHQDFSIFQMKDHPSEKAIAYEYDGKKEKFINLKGDGDFRSEECLKYLKECDIVCTNPPFSLFREYVNKLMEYKKKFLVIGNKNAIAYKDISMFIIKNKLWLGYTSPKKFLKLSNETFEESYQIFGNIGWFTSLPVTYRNDQLQLWKSYNPKEHPFYDGWNNIIEVKKVVNIPKDWDGLMGVPFTFLDKYNPDQFEIIDILSTYTFQNKKILYVNGKKTFGRAIIKRKK